MVNSRDKKVQEANQLLDALQDNLDAYNNLAEPVLDIRIKLARLENPKTDEQKKQKVELEEQLEKSKAALAKSKNTLDKKIENLRERIVALDKEVYGSSSDPDAPSFLDHRR